MSNKFITIYFIIIIILIMLSCTIGGVSTNLPSTEFSNSIFHYNKKSIFSWPLENYTTISSYFGYRKSPTTRCF